MADDTAATKKQGKSKAGAGTHFFSNEQVITWVRRVLMASDELMPSILRIGKDGGDAKLITPLSFMIDAIDAGAKKDGLLGSGVNVIDYAVSGEDGYKVWTVAK